MPGLWWWKSRSGRYGVNQESGYQQVTPEEYLSAEGFEYREMNGSRGRQFNVKSCPACGKDSWKVYIAVDSGFGICFSCSKPFNLWTFAAAHIGTEDKRAIGKAFDDLARQAGWKPARRAREKLVRVTHDNIQLPFNVALPMPDGQTLQYLEDRGVSHDLTRYFDLRYCYDGAWEYSKPGENRILKMAFSGRVLIPIYDLEGKLQTFQGRDIAGTAERKYLFPPQLPGTARFLYNGHNAFEKRSTHVVMGEGAFDVIALKEATLSDPSFAQIEPIGSFGKKLSAGGDVNNPDQLSAFLKLKERGLKVITICWDGEASALTAAVEAGTILRTYGFEVRVAFLPHGKDPAEISVAARRHAIANARLLTTKLATIIRLRNPYGSKS